jgi:Recombination endonuclease VII
MKCKSCSADFEPKNRTHVYCSAKCRNNWRVRDPEKMQAYKQKYRDTSKDKSKHYHLVRNFGITLEQYKEMLQAQNECCAVCGKHAETEGRALAVDHDHSTGEVFGLLCYVCNNKLIGKRRDPELFYKASEYLRRGSGLYVPDDKKKGRPRKRKKLSGKS